MIFCCVIYMKRVSSEEECWAHNPKVGGSIPPPAKPFCKIFQEIELSIIFKLNLKFV